MKKDLYETEALMPDYMKRDFYRILEALYDDFTIISNTGVIESVLPNFEAVYGLPAEEAVGSTIMEMEERKVFDPCISAVAMRTKKPLTMLQHTKKGIYLMCTSIPILNEDGSLYKVVSFTRDSETYERLTEEYANLQQTLTAYSVELSQLRQKLKKDYPIIGTCPKVKNTLHMAEKYSGFDATVLITGESGVGKNLFADMIHQNSKRKDKPFISINCGAIPEHLLESELFGYVKGAFTGASAEGKAGLIELADGGTLFLDEIGEIPLHMQVKLLKVIQEKKVMRVGGLEEKTIDFRLIAATNRDLARLTEEGLFRRDLYYRLNVLPLQVPPLRERGGDIVHLVNYFTRKFSEQYGLAHAFSSDAIDCMEQYSWPGNIRELENTVERALLTAEEFVITKNALPGYLQPDAIHLAMFSENLPLREIMERVEKAVLLKSYETCGTTTGVAKALGISQPSASQKLAKYLDKKE